MMRAGIVAGMLWAAVCSPGEELTAAEALRVLAEVHDAILNHDRARLLQLVEFDSTVTDPDAKARLVVEAPLEKNHIGRFTEPGLLVFHSMDAVNPDVRRHRPTEGMRVLFRVSHPGLSPLNSWIVGFYFVHRDEHWKWRLVSLMFPWDTWTYDWSTPEEAFSALYKALDERDYVGVREMIAPECLPQDVSAADWVATVRTRMKEVDAWNEAHPSPTKRLTTLPTAPPPPPPPASAPAPPPFVAIGKLRPMADGVRRLPDDVVILSCGNEGSTDTEWMQVFVKHGDRWFWRPKPEYTLWPLNPDCLPADIWTQPATQPAAP